MNVVSSPANHFRNAAQSSYCATDECVKSRSPILSNDRLAVFGNEHNVVMQTEMG
jgi:hypothetical protein